jgi:hypothetical protein
MWIAADYLAEIFILRLGLYKLIFKYIKKTIHTLPSSEIRSFSI